MTQPSEFNMVEPKTLLNSSATAELKVSLADAADIKDSIDAHETWQEDFGSGRFGISPHLFFLVRCFLAVWMTAVIPWSIMTWFGGTKLNFYFTKLSFWGLWLEVLYLWLAVASTWQAIWGRSNSDEAPWFARVAMAMQKGVLSMSFLVMMLGWTFIFPGMGPASLVMFWSDRTQVHGYNFVVMVIDLCINRQPLSIRGVVWPVVFNGSYVIFSYIYPTYMGGTFEDGRSPYVYKPLNWSRNFDGALQLSVQFAFVVGPAIYLLCVGLSRVLERAESRLGTSSTATHTVLADKESLDV